MPAVVAVAASGAVSGAAAERRKSEKAEKRIGGFRQAHARTYKTAIAAKTARTEVASPYFMQRRIIRRVEVPRLREGHGRKGRFSRVHCGRRVDHADGRTTGSQTWPEGCHRDHPDVKVSWHQ